MSSTVNNEARSGSYMNISITDRMRERRSTDITGFDIHCIYKRFIDALQEPDNAKSSIGTQDYIDGYQELLK